MPYGSKDIGSGNGVLPDSIKRLPEPMLTNHLSKFSQEMLKISILVMSLKIINLGMQPHNQV